MRLDYARNKACRRIKSLQTLFLAFMTHSSSQNGCMGFDLFRIHKRSSRSLQRRGSGLDGHIEQKSHQRKYYQLTHFLF